ncbi:MAG: hypothetical protein V2J55_01235 [Candidatus Competibacteraceae bacterium]|nr:hypothetical protein [Candidatus Competibacteraceae bacterium]
MPWSLPLAEPLGSAAGLVAGELAHHFAHRIALRLNLNESQAKFVGTAAAHFTVATAVKGVTNVALGDPIGLGINPFTSFTTALVHGAVRVGVDELKLSKQDEQMLVR